MMKNSLNTWSDYIPSSRYGNFFSTKICGIFLKSPGKHMLWVLIRTSWWGTSNEYPQQRFLWRNKKIITPLISSYVYYTIFRKWSLHLVWTVKAQISLYIHVVLSGSSFFIDIQWNLYKRPTSETDFKQWGLMWKSGCLIKVHVM